jgi:class 3 adenylate cyclase
MADVAEREHAVQRVGAADLGDRAWRQLLQTHHDAVRSQLGRFRGKEIDTAGDGFLATFDGPARFGVSPAP